MSDIVKKTMESLADIEHHERAIGREVKYWDKDAEYWLWKLTDTHVLNMIYEKERRA